MLSLINRRAARFLALLIGFVASAIFVDTAGVLGLVLTLVVPFVVVAIHEFGHAVAASALGMNVREISVGPIAYFTKRGRFGWNRKILGYDVGGHVAFDDTKGRDLTRSADRLITLAGPFANLLSAAIVYVVARFFMPDSMLMRLLIGFAFASMSAFVLSAWPLRLASGRANDALAFLQTFDFKSPLRPKRPKRSGWQAP